MEATASTAAFPARRAQAALRDLRTARRHHYVEDFEWVDALYRVYLLTIFGGLGLALISGALGDAAVKPHTVHEIARRGPAVLGALAAGTVAAGIRSGARGGPLAIEAADVQHVLLSPVDRGRALRGIALRRLRTLALAGAALGTLAANFALRRLPGDSAEWLVCGALFGTVVVLAGFGAAMAASGRRLRPTLALSLAVLLLAWSGADILLQAQTSPATMLGQVALWPVHGAGDSKILPAIGLAVAFGITCLGLVWVAGTGLEAARRRAQLVTQLRFAVTLQDLRMVILVRRELAAEHPRVRPWLRLASATGSVGAVWRRGWRSYLRWPPVRIARVVLLGAVAGVALCGAWQGTTPLVLVSAAALLVAAFDVIEPLAQETDHPIRRDLYPVHPVRLIRRHLVAPTALMVGVGSVGIAAAFAVSGSTVALEVGIVMVVPIALLVSLSAALSTTNDPYAYLRQPWVGYVQTAIPFVLAVAATLPVIGAREAEQQGASPLVGAATSEIQPLVICVLLIAFLGRRIARQAGVLPSSSWFRRLLGAVE